ncbi:MAG: hypothetical protein GEU82_03035 [Luteitalea sp.]|nr:hypothetical protein [Luteitalea sp.]
MLAAVALAVLALGSGLRPDAFFVGDPGIKLIAARHALAHPSHPFDIDLPVIGADPAPLLVDPFFIVHGLHSHAITSELFPLLTAPFLAAAGLRGLYVLPALGFLLALAGCGWIGTALDRRRRAAPIAAAAALTTPLLFYGLEFWEHTLAVGVATIATALFIRNTGVDDPPAGRNTGGVMPGVFGSGCLFGVAVLLRPEAAWFAIAVVGASPLLPQRPSLVAIGAAGAGVAVPVASLGVYSLVHFGTLATPHLNNAGAILQDGWLAGRMPIVAAWFLHYSDVNFWRVAPAIVLAAVPLLWGPRRGGTWFLATISVMSAALAVLTAPNDGGGQWGPRYLLFAYVPLAVLVADATEIVRFPRAVAIGLVLFIFTAGVWTQRSAYRRLQGAKQTYGHIVDLIDTTTVPGEYIVTDLWWLDQVAAASRNAPRFLYAASEERATAAMRQLSLAGAGPVTVIRSRETDSRGWIAGTCFAEERRQALDVTEVVAIRFRCETAAPTSRRVSALGG